MPLPSVIPSCPHNHEVQCEVHKCTTCGWDPEVSALRRLLLRKFGISFFDQKLNTSLERNADHA